jgi:hypothetical protein
MQPTQLKIQKLSTPFPSFSHAIIKQQEQPTNFPFPKIITCNNHPKLFISPTPINYSHAINLSKLT